MSSSLRIALRTIIGGVILCSLLHSSAQSQVVDLDSPGEEESLNAQLWEYAKHTPYSLAKLYVAAHRQQASAGAAEAALPTGWKLHPAGRQIAVGRFPSEVVSYAGKIVVLNAGYYSNGAEQPEISIIDASLGTTTTIRVPSLFPSAVAGTGANADLFVSGGVGKQVYRLDQSFNTTRSYDFDGYVGGITTVDSTHLAVLLLVSANSPEELSKGAYSTGKIAILNTETGRVERIADAGYYPYSVASVKGKLYVTVLGEDAVAVYSAADLAPKGRIKVGNKPQCLCLDGSRILVTNTGSDSISVIDTATDKLTDTYHLNTVRGAFGKAPVSCCVDPQGGRIYAALSNSNAVAVLDRRTGKHLGDIPAGWYPTKTLISGGQLIVLNGKGIRNRRPNVNGPQPAANRGGPEYVLTLLNGSASVIPITEIAGKLPDWTRTVAGSAPDRISEVHPGIKHIFYVVRENRTYDQVLGDLHGANGDPNLTLFGREITPNGHKIAESFVTLDNYFADGEISVLGHSFTTSGYASPFLEWLGNAAYSGRYTGYPFGMVPAATSPAYLWDALDRKGLNYRIFGENYYLYTRAYDILKQVLGPDNEVVGRFYAQMMKLATQVDRGAAFYQFANGLYGRADTPAAAAELLENHQFLSDLSHFLSGDDTLTALIPLNEELKHRFAAYLSHYSFNYRSWDLKTSDLDRMKAWKQDFDSQLASGNVASLEYIWLPNDHTGGTSKTYLPPDQLVAQNDAALGYLLQTISRSAIWKDSLILVTEDDAQNGPDHVDATRTVALAAGPFVKRGVVISDRFDQLSLLRTIGVALGLPPLNQNDALAAPMYSLFTAKPDLSPYFAVPVSHLAEDDMLRLKRLTGVGIK